MIEADFQEFYHLDLADARCLERHSIRWLKVRLLGLLNIGSRLRYAIHPPKKTDGKGTLP